MKRFRDTKYLVTEDGRVYSEITNKFLKLDLTNQGYYRTYVGNGKRKLVHSMVAECYIENPNNYKCINHINNIRNDNRIENLEWCTQQMNMDHCFKQGRNARGISHSSAKLTEEDVIEIRRIYANKEMTQVEIGHKYNVNSSIISQIVNYKNWKHIKD